MRRLVQGSHFSTRIDHTDLDLLRSVLPLATRRSLGKTKASMAAPDEDATAEADVGIQFDLGNLAAFDTRGFDEKKYK